MIPRLLEAATGVSLSNAKQGQRFPNVSLSVRSSLSTKTSSFLPLRSCNRMPPSRCLRSDRKPPLRSSSSPWGEPICRATLSRIITLIHQLPLNVTFSTPRWRKSSLLERIFLFFLSILWRSHRVSSGSADYELQTTKSQPTLFRCYILILFFNSC